MDGEGSSDSVVVRKSVHEQDDGIILAMAVTGGLVLEVSLVGGLIREKEVGGYTSGSMEGSDLGWF